MEVDAKSKTLRNLNFIFFLVSLLLTLIIPNEPSQWERFADTRDYLKQSQFSPFSRDFYSARPSENFYPRPFTVPMLYKIAGSRPEAIVAMQKMLHWLSVFMLVSALMLFLKSAFIRFLLIISVYFLMSWWNIAGWTTQVLSESIAFSFLLCWLAACLFLFKFRTWRMMLLHIAVTILFCFTRDSWIYIVLCFYLMILVTAFLLDRQFLKYTVVMLLTGILIFFIQGASSRIGQRTKLPVANSIVLRILPDNRYYAWFEARGMPDATIIKKRLSSLDIRRDEEKARFFALYSDPEYRNFLDWSADQGRKNYVKFLITHPGYSLLLNESPEKLDRIFAMNLDYMEKVNGYSLVAEMVFPVFSPLSGLILSLILVIIFIKRKDPALLLPLFTALMFVLNVFLLYNADTMEVDRHLLFTLIMVQLLCIWACALILDEFISRVKGR